MRKTVLLFSAFLCLGLSVPLRAEGPPPGDKLSQGLWWLYQLQYEKARENFDAYAKENPADPAGYFYKSATDWWQLAQNFDYPLPEIRARLEQDYQDTIRVGTALRDSSTDPKIKSKACLYLGGAEGLKGRWLVTQEQWVKAYFLGKRGARLLRESLEYDPTQYDADMGLGIYDYFTDTLPGVQGVLAYLFIHGDKARGLQELQTAIDKSQHARVEAMFFLIEIYTSEENTPGKALPLTRALRKEFPQSPAMHLAEIMTLYGMKAWGEVIPDAQSFLELSQKEPPYYTKSGVQPALYCLGSAALWGKKDLDQALKYMDDILNDDIDSSRWVTFAFLRRGQIYDLKGLRASAIQDYKTVLSRQNFWGAHEEAKQYLSKPFTYLK